MGDKAILIRIELIDLVEPPVVTVPALFAVFSHVMSPASAFWHIKPLLPVLIRSSMATTPV